MKIAIEAQRIFRPKKHGMDFVALEMIRQLKEIDHKNEYRIYVAPGTDHCLTESENFKIEILPSSNYLKFEQIDLPRALHDWKPDLLHCTSNTAPLNINVPLILTLHDVIFLEKYGSKGMSLYQRLGKIYRKFVVPRVLEKVKRVITVSDYERDVICGATSLCPLKIDVVYNGVSSRFRPTPISEATRQKYSLPDEYIFFIGNTDPKKNARRTIEAYSLYAEQTKNPLKLVVADYPKELTEGVKGVVSIGYIANEDLPEIYSGARIFLYPSLRESFGIPILEAMGCGTPVITSDTSAIPEVASDAALLIDPYEVSSIKNAIGRLAGDPKLRAYYSSKGIERNAQFSWSGTASEVLKIYEKL